MPLCVAAGLDTCTCVADEVVDACVVDAGELSVAVDFAAVVVLGIDFALVFVLFNVTVKRCGLTVTVDLMKVVVVLPVPALPLALALVLVLLSSAGIIQNSADTNPPLLCASSSPCESVARTSQGILQSPKHCTVHS